MSSYNLTHLKQLEAESIHIIREVAAEFQNPVMLYSIGKDSSVMVRLAQKAFHPGRLPFPLMHVNTTWKFRDMIAFRDQYCRENGFELIEYVNREGLEAGANPFDWGSNKYTTTMKTEGLKQALNKYGFDAAFGGARRDEEKSRAKERVYSFRDRQHQWDPKNQRPELWNLYNGKVNKGESIRVFPLSNWTELDVWQYIHLENIPIVPLYFAADRPVVYRDGTMLMVDDERMRLQPGEKPETRRVRFRTLGCYPLTGAIESSATTLPEIIQEMLVARNSERQGRMIDHDEAGSMEQKKREGYFYDHVHRLIRPRRHHHFYFAMQQVESLNEDIETYLERNQRKELLRFLTCGSVDDGKSTLIGRLLHDTKGIYEDQLAAVKRDSVKHGTTGTGEVDLALLTDGLKAEREQGITIDVAYRYFSTDKRKFIIADTPGHEQYTRNMATGASTCQLAIILIDARHGVMSQTRRHSFIVSLLGIRHVIVAINKMDLVGYEQSVFERIQREYTGFVAKLGIPDVQFIPMSALKGENVVDQSKAMPWYDGPPLLSHLETVHIASDRNLAEMRFPVQYVLRPNLDFRGFSGTLASGILRLGDEVVALPSGKRSRVKSIVTFDGELNEAFSPMAVTVTLADEIDVSRGDVLVHADSQPHVAATVEAMVVWMGEKPFVPGRSYWVKHTTRTVAGEIAELRYGVDVNTLERRPATQLAMNEVGHVVLGLNQPIAYDAYKANAATGAFIVVDRLTNNTVGAGMLLEPGDRRGAGDHWGQEPVSARLKVRASQIALAERERRFGQRGVTILLNGLTGSGKASIAYALEKRLFDAGRAVTVLYGQNMRQGLCRDLGFTADERSENLRRSAEVARILNDGGMICICAFVAPHDAVRQKAREVVGAERFIEVYLNAPLEVLKQRDSSGAYEAAEAGRIAQFPGVSAVYEEPSNSDLVLPTHEVSVEEGVDRIVALLRAKGVIG